MEEERILRYTLTTREIKELARRLSMGCIIVAAPFWLVLLTTIFLVLLSLSSGVLSIGLAVRSFLVSISICGVAVLAYALKQYATHLWLNMSHFLNRECRYRLDQGTLTDLVSKSVLHGSNFSGFSQTSHLLLLKRPVCKGKFKYYVFPKRIFKSEEDIQECMAYFLNFQPVCRENPDGPARQDGAEGEEDGLKIAFSLSADGFAHVYTQLVWFARIVDPSAINKRLLIMLSFPLVVIIATVFPLLRDGEIISGILDIFAGIAWLTYLLLKYSDIRESTFRKQLSKNKLPANESGAWEIRFSQKIIYLKHNLDSYERRWDIFKNLCETIDTYYLICISSKRIQQYVFIPKWAFGDEHQEHSFLDICAAHGLSKQYIHILEAEDPVGTAARLRRRNIPLIACALVLAGLSIALLLLKLILLLIF